MSVPRDGRYRVWAGEPKGRARDEKRCWEEVFPSGRELHHQCGKTWTVERDGQRFCAQHDPEAVARKRAEQEAKWKADSKAQDEKWERQRAVYAACEGVATKDLKPGMLAKLLAEKGR